MLIAHFLTILLAFYLKQCKSGKGEYNARTNGSNDTHTRNVSDILGWERLYCLRSQQQKFSENLR